MEKTKYCPKCDEDKLISEFYRDKSRKDGRTSHCKECRTKYERSPAGKKLRRRSSRRYEASVEGKKVRRRWKSSLEGKASSKRYDTSEKGRIAIRRYDASKKGKAAKQRYKQAHPRTLDLELTQRKERAYYAVRVALETGELVRPSKCEKHDGTCSGRIEAHHEDYDKQLDVNWLCVSHHRRRHVELKTLNSVEVVDG